MIHNHHITSQNALQEATPQQKAMQTLVDIMSQDQNVDYKQSMRFALLLACEYLQMPIGVTCQIDGDNYVVEVCTVDEEPMLPEYVVEEGVINTVNNTPYAMLMASPLVVAIEQFSKHPETKQFLSKYQTYSALIGTQLTRNEQCVGGLIFFDQASRPQPFTKIEKEFVHMLGQWMQKIMHQNRLDEQLSLSNERITLALSGGNLGLWDVDFTNKNVVLNDRWLKMLGYKVNELTHSLSVWKQLMHPEDKLTAFEDFKLLVKGEADEVDHIIRMQSKSGGWVWVHNRGKVVTRDLHGKPTRIMGTHMDISALKNAEEEVKQLAFYDVLTGLPNRRLLLDRLKLALVQSARNNTYGALIFIDLDDFKMLNETLGHDQGDRLLKSVAERLSQCLRDGDTVARFGGDEFVVMLDNLESDANIATTQVEKVGDKIIESLNQPYQLNGIQHHSSPTLGATLFNGTADKIEDTLQKADIAMYQAKNAGKNCLRFFDQSIQSNLLNKTRLAEDLRIAIEDEQFVLYYQPQVNRNGEISGAEALVRWIHPTRGMVSPLDFIPLAEETGLITALGGWVMEAGCKQLVEWEKDPKTANQDLSVNVSARQFQQPDFVKQVVSTIQKTGANPKKLKLELTESMLVDDVDDVISKMSQLRLHGVSFSLDDFGTGVSSLRYLKLFPLTQLKIDKSFVDDILTDTNDAVIARTIVALANSLGLNVIAEGVEIEGQRDFLAQNGCHDYQGYLFSRPLNIGDYNKLCGEYEPPKLTEDDALKNMLLL